MERLPNSVGMGPASLFSARVLVAERKVLWGQEREGEGGKRLLQRLQGRGKLPKFGGNGATELVRIQISKGV